MTESEKTFACIESAQMYHSASQFHTYHLPFFLLHIALSFFFFRPSNTVAAVFQVSKLLWVQ